MIPWMVTSFTAYHMAYFCNCSAVGPFPSPKKPFTARYSFLKAPVNSWHPLSEPILSYKPGLASPPCLRLASRSPHDPAPPASGTTSTLPALHLPALRVQPWLSLSWVCIKETPGQEGATEGVPLGRQLGQGGQFPVHPVSHQSK